MNDHTWRDRALCLGDPSPVWVGDDLDPDRIAAAKAICAACPVQRECGEALRRQIRHSCEVAGIWAGSADADRRGTRAVRYDDVRSTCRHVSCQRPAGYAGGQLCAGHYAALCEPSQEVAA